MCFFKKDKTEIAAAPAAPEAIAEEQEVGSARRAEDETLFGSSAPPDLRVDRSVSAGTGTGLKMM